MPHIVGLDIGGANLKAARNDGLCRSCAFPLWKSPERLADELRQLIGDWLPCRAVALTMTGELADCFETKAAGVEAIVRAVTSIAPHSEVLVWQTVGEFVPPDVAIEFPMLTAASNWHLQASFVGQLAPSGGALLIDIGSTTTDIIPLSSGVPVARGMTDVERLQSGELVYCGARRTPLCALTESVSRCGVPVRVAAELFATTLDVYLLTGDLPEAAHDCDTANGRAATRSAAHDRIARMLCCDRDELSFDEAVAIATQFRDAQIARISSAVDAVLAGMESPCEHLILSGSGCFLAELVVSQHPQLSRLPCKRLDSVFSPEICEAACAFSAARLAENEAVGIWLGHVWDGGQSTNGKT